MRIQGRWRIIEMEVWDREATDLLELELLAVVQATLNAIARSRELTVGAAILTGIKGKLIDALEA